MIPPALESLQTLYKSLDQDIAAFKTSTGLGCAPGCGACCLVPSRQITASVLEMIPLAQALFERGLAQEFHARAQTADLEKPCMLFEPGQGPGQGRCSEYQHRPLLCRLFGFAGIRNKHNQRVHIPSRVMKAGDPETVQKAQSQVAEGLNMPVFGDWGQRVQGLEPALSQESHPLSRALVMAIEWVSLRIKT